MATNYFTKFGFRWTDHTVWWGLKNDEGTSIPTENWQVDTGVYGFWGNIVTPESNDTSDDETDPTLRGKIELTTLAADGSILTQDNIRLDDLYAYFTIHAPGLNTVKAYIGDEAAFDIETGTYSGGTWIVQSPAGSWGAATIDYSNTDSSNPIFFRVEPFGDPATFVDYDVYFHKDTSTVSTWTTQLDELPRKPNEPWDWFGLFWWLYDPYRYGKTSLDPYGLWNPNNPYPDPDKEITYGEAKTITAFNPSSNDDYGDGFIVATTATAHGMVNGDYIKIEGSNYDGEYRIYGYSSDTFIFQADYVEEDDYGISPTVRLGWAAPSIYMGEYFQSSFKVALENMRHYLEMKPEEFLDLGMWNKVEGWFDLYDTFMDTFKIPFTFVTKGLGAMDNVETIDPAALETLVDTYRTKFAVPAKTTPQTTLESNITSYLGGSLTSVVQNTTSAKYALLEENIEDEKDRMLNGMGSKLWSGQRTNAEAKFASESVKQKNVILAEMLTQFEQLSQNYISQDRGQTLQANSSKDQLAANTSQAAIREYTEALGLMLNSALTAFTKELEKHNRGMNQYEFAARLRLQAKQMSDSNFRAFHQAAWGNSGNPDTAMVEAGAEIGASILQIGQLVGGLANFLGTSVIKSG